MQKKSEIESYIENHTTTTASFIVTMKSVQLKRMMKSGLEKVFKLDTSLPLTNMHAFDANTSIHKYTRPEDIVEDYFPVRLGLYHDRKEVLERSKEHSASIMKNKARFIENVVDGQIDLMKGSKSKIDTVALLQELGFDSSASLDKLLIRSKDSISEESEVDGENKIDDHDEIDDGSNLKEYDYLLNMPLSSLTLEKIDALRNDADKTERELEETRNATAEMLWHADLDKLDEYMRKTMKH